MDFWKITLHEYMCKHGHIKYGEYTPEICNICGNKEFTLIAKNAGEITKDGFTRTSKHNNSEK